MHVSRRAFVTSLLAASWRRTAASVLQTRLDQAMLKRQGSALVLDVVSGRVLAEHRVAAAARRLVPPGSVIKPFVLAAMLRAQIVDSKTRRKCSRTLRIKGRRLDCSHADLAEGFDPVSALAYSCNSYFAELAGRMKVEDLLQTLRSFGLTSLTQFAGSEVTGRITPPPDAAQLQLLALGEDGVLITALEIAGAYRLLALIARDGNARAMQLAPVFNGLREATQYGTARLARPPSVAVAGKTGTAAGQSGRRTHAWFAGYAPEDRPEIAIAVFLETGSGGGDAAPVAREVFSAL